MKKHLIGLTDAEEILIKDAGLKLANSCGVRRWTQLEEAYRASRLWSAADDAEHLVFSCSSAAECGRCFHELNSHLNLAHNHRGTVANYFAEGYDRIRNAAGDPLRVCVVSIDSGGWTYDFARQTELDQQSGLDFTNQHWLATRRLMHYLFFGDYNADVVLNPLALKLFTHVRAIKCSAGRNWRQPAVMYKNCLHHLQFELSVLEPTVLVAQGFNPRHQSTPCTTGSVVQVMNRLSETHGRDITQQVFEGSGGPGNITIWHWDAPWGSSVLLGSYHPSSKGLYTKRDTGALDAALKPAIAWLRRRDFRL